ncbi:MAG: FtsX-like permease family protein [Gallintestinimicrobium sp.]
MLKELSIRNAKRQSKDYLLYFITLTCTVSFMYAFNSLIFSDIMKVFPSIDVLPYMITVASLLIVLIMGWIVGYMTKYILKKRSRELSIYMISGIPNRSICRLIFYENTLIGIFAFVIGLPVGILFSQLLEAVLSSMFGVMYVLKWNFSFKATALTCLYFLAMLFYAIRRNNKWISKITLYDLLYYERQNEKSCCMTGNLPLHCFLYLF